MTMAYPANEGTFDALFQEASVSGLLGLNWQQFENFIEHVFTYAGYMVKVVSNQKWPHGSGFDLELYDPHTHKFVSFVEVRRLQEDNLLNFTHVATFIGKLTLAQKGVPSFMVTTSDFTEPARLAAKEHGNVFLMDGERLLRFITYIGNSRLKDQNIQSDPPVFISPVALWNAERITFRDPHQTTIMTIGNNKGGVGNTTIQ